MAVTSQDQQQAILIEVVERLRREFAPEAIYLFGSRAYGSPNPQSDLDLLIVVGSDNRDPYERDAAAYRCLAGISVAKDVLVYTREEFESRAAFPSSFERTVRTKGKLLYAA
ncbi:MAG TPA: nucleotidyltransferase domain-containing protein [Phycisphaerae bacterium]|nr:nucleotidyltransferase domain-containing protein [Phycisphaerae bacterium]